MDLFEDLSQLIERSIEQEQIEIATILLTLRGSLQDGSVGDFAALAVEFSKRRKSILNNEN